MQLDLLTCENCNSRYDPRPLGDMADLNNLCRRCAEECAAQLEVDYNLPLGCSDEERQLALNPPEDRTTWVFRCYSPACSTWKRFWSTTLTYEEWTMKYGRGYHCFSCGEPSALIRTWKPDASHLA